MCSLTLTYADNTDYVTPAGLTAWLDASADERYSSGPNTLCLNSLPKPSAKTLCLSPLPKPYA
jgi:hypothetical protein